MARALLARCASTSPFAHQCMQGAAYVMRQTASQPRPLAATAQHAQPNPRACHVACLGPQGAITVASQAHAAGRWLISLPPCGQLPGQLCSCCRGCCAPAPPTEALLHLLALTRAQGAVPGVLRA